ncbi:galactosyltransferase-related protein, partial [Sutterella wadsworthensis]
SVNGLDESFEGWGQEDSDMVIRLINNEVLLRTGRYGGIPVFHLWHRQVTREGEYEKKALLMERLEKKIVRPIKGIY